MPVDNLRNPKSAQGQENTVKGEIGKSSGNTAIV